jgi:cytidine deaminase
MSQNATSAPLTPDQIDDLHRRATAAAHHAYAPYSHFRVGAAIFLEDGNIITGCNVENASYRLTTCAEQAAIASAVSQHGPAIRIRAVIVVNLNSTASQPCGACRQTIYEFSTPDTEIFYPGEGNTVAHTSMRDLLPSAFSFPSDNL